MATLAHSPINDTQRKDFMKSVRALGTDTRKGAGALPKLALEVVRAAAQAIISTDDAKGIYEAYLESSSDKVQHTVNGKEANASKLRQFIKLGAAFPRDAANPDDHSFAEWLITKSMELRVQGIENGEDPKNFLPPYQGALQVAKAQIAEDRRGVELADDEVAALIRRPGAQEKEEDRELEKMEKALEKILNGNKSTGEGRFPSPQAESALELILKRRKELAALAAEREKLEDLASKGLSAAPTPGPRAHGHSLPVTEDTADDTPEADDAMVGAVPNADNMTDEELAAELEARVAANSPELPAEELVTGPVTSGEDAPLDAGWEDAAPVEEAPVEEAPVEEAPATPSKTLSLPKNKKGKGKKAAAVEPAPEPAVPAETHDDVNDALDNDPMMSFGG